MSVSKNYAYVLLTFIGHSGSNCSYTGQVMRMSESSMGVGCVL